MKPLSKFRNFLFLIGLTLSVALVTSCGKSNNPEKPEPVIKLATNTMLGSYLTNSEGQALYIFLHDSNGANTCTGNCANLWPSVFRESLTAQQLGKGLALSDFAQITTAGGEKQLTYKGWPLYYYAPVVNGQNVRELSGETNGEGVGGVWFVAKPNYTTMLANRQPPADRPEWKELQERLYGRQRSYPSFYRR